MKLEIFLVYSPLTFVQFFDHNLIFIYIYYVKIGPLESRFKEISNDIKIIKIGLKIRKLWYFEVWVVLLASRLMKNRLILWVCSWAITKERFGQKVCNSWWANSWNTLKFVSKLVPTGKITQNVLKHPKLISFHSKFIKTLSSSLPPSLTLKKDLPPLIFSFKFLQEFLKIGSNTNGNKHGAGNFMLKAIRRRWWIMNPKGILEDLPFPSSKR